MKFFGIIGFVLFFIQTVLMTVGLASFIDDNRQIFIAVVGVFRFTGWPKIFNHLVLVHNILVYDDQRVLSVWL
jgi:hypothetical protein